MFLGWLLAGCGGNCEVEAPLDYAGTENWLCLPGQADDACPETIATRTFAADGTVTDGSITSKDDPGLACFLVYPTLDLRLTVGLHDKVESVSGPERWAGRYGGPLQQRCAVYVPVYRQVRIGTYLGKDSERKSTCFESAYRDVDAAFDAFLEREPTRPFVVFGHSQGGQHLSRLLHTRIEEDEALRDRLIAAYPIGWGVATAEGSTTGGSFDKLEPCSTRDQTGCIVGFRSFLQGETPPGEGRFSEGDTAICVDPSLDGHLAGLALDPGNALLTTDIDASPGTMLIWPDAFDATCAGEGMQRGLEVEWVRDDKPPFDLSDPFITGSTNASHVLDLPFGFLDILDDIDRRHQAWLAR